MGDWSLYKTLNTISMTGHWRILSYAFPRILFLKQKVVFEKDKGTHWQTDRQITIREALLLNILVEGVCKHSFCPELKNFEAWQSPSCAGSQPFQPTSNPWGETRQTTRERVTHPSTTHHWQSPKWFSSKAEFRQRCCEKLAESRIWDFTNGSAEFGNWP